MQRFRIVYRGIPLKYTSRQYHEWSCRVCSLWMSMQMTVLSNAFEKHRWRLISALNQSLIKQYAVGVLKINSPPHPERSDYMLPHRRAFIGPIPLTSLRGNILNWVRHIIYTAGCGYWWQVKLVHSSQQLKEELQFANKLSFIKKSIFLPKQVLLDW